MSNYAPGTWSPVLAFGGASTGITYSTQQGEYTQIGNMVFYNIFLILTSKGSATGGATISLPSPATGGNLTLATAGYWTSITLTTNYTSVGGYAQSNVLNLVENGNNVASTALLNTNFANTTAIGISGFYFTS